MSKAALCMFIQVFSKYEFFISLEEMPQSVVTGSRLTGIVLSCFSKHSGYAISHSLQECVSSGLSQWPSVFSLIKNVAFSSSCRLVVKSPCGFILHFPRPKTHLSVFSSLALLLLQGSTSSLTSQTTVFHMCVLETVVLLCSLIPGLSLMKSWGIPSRKFTSCASRAT